MITIDQETKELMNKLGTALEKVYPSYFDKARRYFRHDGEPVKLYAHRGRGISNYNVTTDKDCQKVLEWCLDTIRSAFNLNVSTSVLFRRALLAYQETLMETLTSQGSHTHKDIAKYMIKLEAEREKLYGVSKRKQGM